ncbi:transcriptional regulator, Crp/Fnr family [Desulfosporosinus sp. I2]|uniref:Crp/Fnr family transcriptional regulator n=1 Tax=Desulfosporosinus sp. I2 TaxID=1617025 RepID=UPI00061F541C|nr:Crp/Fnr family transcriptional regulator [Desulfosporosinus sp. I2]KJR45946.1 transcriptional regulator, Crp/Fnr family [Desulfosporosinus sp. I2]
MIDQKSKNLYGLFPFLQDVKIHTYGLAPVKLHAGVCAFTDGGESTSIPLLIKGSIKVLKTAESGREILLYRIKPGETCIIMLSSALGNIPYPATAIVEQEMEALMIPNELYKYWLQHIPAVQTFTYQSMAQRLGSVMALIEEITFKRIDIRLIRFLLEHTSERQAILYETHEEVAIELGTAREVISRLLKNMEGDHFANTFTW